MRANPFRLFHVDNLVLPCMVITLMSFSLVAGCTPDATPFPVDLPTTTSSTPPPGSTSTVRYALAENTNGLVNDLALIQAAAQVEQLTEPINSDDLGSRYDMVVTYGDLQGGTRSPSEHHISLIINPATAPLDNPVLRNILRRSLEPQAIVTALEIPGMTANILESSAPTALRTELANEGWPDGLSLTLAYDHTPGVAHITQQLKEAGIQARLLPLTADEIMIAFDEGRIQAAIIAWKTIEEQQGWISHFGDGNVIDLYTVPISYIGAAGIRIEFTPGGWPIPTQ